MLEPCSAQETLTRHMVLPNAGCRYYFNEDDFNPFASTSRVPGSSMGSLRSMSSAHSGGWGAIGGQRSAPHSRTGSELVAGSVEREQVCLLAFAMLGAAGPCSSIRGRAP